MADTPETMPPPKHQGSRIAATVKALVRTRVMTGLIVVLPIYVTILLAKFVFGVTRDASQWVVFALLEASWFQKRVWKLELPKGESFDLAVVMERYPWLDWGIAIFSVLLTIFLLYIIGLFAANLAGRRVIALFDSLIERVPLVKTIYRSSKQILSTFSGDQTQSFQRVALIPFPHEKMRCVGFVTNIFKDSVSGEELCSVFISTTPNPTTGYLQILKRSEITELNWTVEEGVRAVISAGILMPDFLTIMSNKDLPPDVLQAQRLPRNDSD
ncbi:MAG: DUF502 domain-containing protein [Planctomycetota bacterium]